MLVGSRYEIPIVQTICNATVTFVTITLVWFRYMIPIVQIICNATMITTIIDDAGCPVTG